MENRKELIKKFRSFVVGGQYASRTTLLAYAFLREVPYVALERKINEDHDTFNTEAFLMRLATDTTRCITEAYFGKRSWELKDNEIRQQFRDFEKSINDDVFAWIQEKYKTVSNEVAA